MRVVRQNLWNHKKTARKNTSPAPFIVNAASAANGL